MDWISFNATENSVTGILHTPNGNVSTVLTSSGGFAFLFGLLLSVVDVTLYT